MELVILTENNVSLEIQPGSYTHAVEQTLLRSLTAKNGLGQIAKVELLVSDCAVMITDRSTVTPRIQRFGLRADMAANICRVFRGLFPDEFNRAETSAMSKKYSSQN